MNMINEYATHIALVIAAIILLVLGRGPLLPDAGSSDRVKWLAFAVSALAGGALGYGLYPPIRWLVEVVSGWTIFAVSVISVAALWVGWVAAHKLFAMARDLGDKKPDAEARSAALWVPTLLPIGWAAVMETASNPGGLPTSIAGAAMAVITLVYCNKITNTVLHSTNGKRVWKWVAVGANTLAGLVLIVAFAYVDAQLAKWLSGQAMFIIRVCVGVAGIALIFPAVKDLLKEKDQRGRNTYEPDEHVRRFCKLGIPSIVLAGAAGLGLILTGSSESLQIITGTIQ